MQIAQELLSDQTGAPVLLIGVRNLKFRQPITPEMQVRYVLTDNKITIEDLEATQYAQFAVTYMCAHTDL